MEKGLWRGRNHEVSLTYLISCISTILFITILHNSANRNFDFKEKAEVDKYYPQYYHKMDKVCLCHLDIPLSYGIDLMMLGWPAHLH